MLGLILGVLATGMGLAGLVKGEIKWSKNKTLTGTACVAGSVFALLVGAGLFALFVASGMRL